MDRETLIRELKLRREQHIRRCLRDPLYWVTKGTRTFDEQDKEDPFKPFPYKPYSQHVLDLFENEPIVFLEKSRTMMASWHTAAWCAHHGFSRPFTVVFQSQDEDRAVADVDMIKCLWNNSEPELKVRWPLSKPMEKQSYNYLEMANGSWFLGIPGDPNKVRSSHPTCYVADEAAFMTYGADAYGNAVGTRALHIVCLSSANPGWFYDFTKGAKPAPWPIHWPRRVS